MRPTYRQRQRLLQIFRLLLTTLALLAIALVSALITMRIAIHGAEVQIPDTRGLTVAEAMDRISATGLNATISDRYASAEVPTGHIIAQAPVPGTTVRRDWIVRLTESLGPPRVTVPNVVGLDQRNAALAIRHAGLDLGVVALLPQPRVKPGTVIAQDPPPATLSADRTRISILLAADTSCPTSAASSFRMRPFLPPAPDSSSPHSTRAFPLRRSPPADPALSSASTPLPEPTSRAAPSSNSTSATKAL
jgi:hypothetical protein